MNHESCDNGFLTSFKFQIRKDVEEPNGNGVVEIFDKLAGVGFNAECSNGSWIGHAMKTDIGEWLNKTAHCQPDFAICGLRYQSNPDFRHGNCSKFSTYYYNLILN